VRLVGAQAQLFPNWRHYAALTNRTEILAVVEASHRDHANIELEIRDLVDQALAHAPSGQFNANAAWTVIAAIAHTSCAGSSCSDCLTRHPAALTPTADDYFRCPAA